MSAIHWHVLGPGALGGLLGGLLALSGQTPVLLQRQAPQNGRRRLQLDMDGQIQELTLPAEQVGAAGAPISYLLVTLKAYDVAPALAALKDRLAPGAVVVLLSNGMGYQEEAAASLHRCTVLPATTTQGAWRRDDGSIVRAGDGQLWLGHAAPLSDATLAERLTASLAATGVECLWSEDIELKRWHKLAINAAINPLSALLNCRNGELLSEPDGPALMAGLCQETEQLMAALGMAQPPGELLARARFVAAQTAANYSSMCQDVRAGRETEIRYITGYLLQRAAEFGLALPGHQQLLHCLHLQQRLSRQR